VLQGFAPLEVTASVSVQPPNRVIVAVLLDYETNTIDYVHSVDGLTTVSFQAAMEKLPPGEHRLRVEAIDDSAPLDDGRGNLAYSDPVTITLDHPAWFAVGYDTPGLCHPGGSSLYIQAQVTRPVFDTANLAWITVYEPSGTIPPANLFGGSVNTAFGGSLVQTVQFLSPAGLPIPAPQPYYDVVLAYPPSELLPADDSSTIRVTNRYFTEVIWPTNSNEAFVAYQPIWGSAVGNVNADFLQEKMDDVWERYTTRYSSGPRPEIPGAFSLNTSNKWQEAYNWMGRPLCRNLFYFGHGSRFNIGYSGAANNDLAISTAAMLALLGNFGPDGSGENEHPYRSAIIIGCNAARTDGQVFEALLGIPQDKSADKINAGWFSGLGIPSRAGVGFTDYKFAAAQSGGVILVPNTELVNGTQRLIEAWTATHPDTGDLLNNLGAAVTISQTDPGGGANKSMRNGIRIIGDKTLMFYSFPP